MSKPRIVIVGGGFAGATTARELRRLGGYEVAIELISHRNYMLFQPLLPEVAGGAVNVLDTVTPLRQMVSGGSLHTGEVRSIDFAARRVELAQGGAGSVVRVPYDHLVLAPGLGVDLSAFPGLAEHAFPLKSALDAHALRNHVISCLEQASQIADQGERERLLTFVVVGGGLSGVEVMGEVHDLIRRSLRYYPDLSRGEVRAELIETGPRILAELHEDLAERAASRLRSRGIAIRTNTPVREASARSIIVGDGRVIPTATIVATIGNAPTPLVQGLDLPKEKGRILVDPDLRVRGHASVWALGDAAFVPSGERGGLAPPTAQAAVSEAKLLARNLLAVIDGKPTRPFRYRSKGTLASVGGRRGVATVGGMKLDGVLAWLLWRLVHLKALPRASVRWRVGLEQLLDLFLPRNAVVTALPSPSSARFVRHRPGDLAFDGRDIAEGAFLIAEGRYVVEAPGQEPRFLHPGDHFGASETLDKMPSAVTVRAVEPSRALQLSPDTLRGIIAALEVGGSLGGVEREAEARRPGISQDRT
ncbi:FAD-dependent oxidoreductase [Novispirillum sp. DQ9]|uniref:FAD-dependent oxidoreductase n=1 Tax=Novispirillum sp. DQ9 TaxID=3398612 RepID=UPI003C7EAC67